MHNFGESLDANRQSIYFGSIIGDNKGEVNLRVVIKWGN